MSEGDDYREAGEPTPHRPAPAESSEQRVARLTLLVVIGVPFVVLLALLVGCGLFALTG